MIYRLSGFLVNAVAPAFGMLLSLWIIWNVETRFFPVVNDFTFVSITKSEQGYTAYGELNKSRACEFLGLTIYAHKPGHPKLLLDQYKKDIFGSDVGAGRQTWGPWTVQLPERIREYEHLEIQGTHRCHALWLQTSEYANLDIRKLP